jgi:23S rRNA (adenine2503-C2)-methyltransferase
VVDAGYPSFRADQISRHYFAHGGETPEGWSDVPVRQREPLSELILPALLDPVHTVSADGGLTQKFLWRLTDGSLVETVLMRYPSSMGSVRRAGTRGRKGDPRPRVTVCVSSQSGCGMGCPFCATGQGGLARSLSTAEIVDQVVRVAHALGQGPLAAGSAGVAGAGPGAGERITNVVFMGMGEPLANYTAVVRAVRRLTAPVPAGFGLSARNLTVSTVGLIPAMQRLAGEQLPVTLALSLHAPDDPLRDELVPVNRRWPVRESLDAAYDYFRATGRRVSIEYALIRDVNDQSWRADLLGSLLSSRAQGWAHVNLIPLNPTPGSRWTASRPEVATEFQRRLQQAGVTTTVRDNRGQQAAAACGQLAGRWPAPGEHGQAPVSVC